MKRCNMIKKVVSFVTALMVVLMPVSAMAAEPVDADVVSEASASPRYTQWFDGDISAYVPTIDDTVHAHLKLLYSYSEGSWVYIETDPTPTLSGIYTDTGFAENTVVTTTPSYGTADFSLTLSSSSGVDRVTLRVNVDIYGEFSWYIL